MQRRCLCPQYFCTKKDTVQLPSSKLNGNEHGPFVDDLAIKNCDFHSYANLPKQPKLLMEEDHHSSTILPYTVSQISSHYYTDHDCIPSFPSYPSNITAKHLDLPALLGGHLPTC